MRRSVLIVVGAWMLLAATGGVCAVELDGVYLLGPDAGYAEGCFPPCMCPLQVTELEGSFRLTFLGDDGDLAVYAVDAVNWTTEFGGEVLRLTGAGIYSISRTVPTAQELELDLLVNLTEYLHMESGVVPADAPPGNIVVDVAANGFACFDRALAISAWRLDPGQLLEYRLRPQSIFQQGCWPPCECAMGEPRPLRGRLVLAEIATGPLHTEYAVTAADLSAEGGPRHDPLPITGVGRFTVSGEVVPEHRIQLDLKVGTDPPAAFDSGWVVGPPAFPEIDTQVSINGLWCFDRLLRIRASPVHCFADGFEWGDTSAWSASSP